jgi:DNA-directed RNA polymerase subunit RPC12/RpoP
MARIEECRKCSKPFVVSGGRTGPVINREDPVMDQAEIDCPHCGDMWGGALIADGFQTRKLTPDEEAEYNRSKEP